MLRKVITKKEVATPEGIIDSFIINLDSIRVFVTNVEPVVIEYDKSISKKLSGVRRDITKIITQGRKVTANGIKTAELKIPTKKAERVAIKIMRLLMDYDKLPRINVAQVGLLYKSSFVMLISFLDNIIHDMIHCYYRMYPEALSETDLSINLSELKLCADRDEAIDIIVNKKVDSVMYGNLRSQRLYLKNNLGIDVGEEIIDWDVVNEAVERRNIIIHNNSIINRRYLGSVNYSVLPEKRGEIREGKQLGITAQYFKKVSDEILITGVVLVQKCWRKWMKDDIKNADSDLIRATNRLLLRGEWNVVERIGTFSKDVKVYDAASRHLLDINYCESLKWQGKETELGVELNKFDESNLRPRFLVTLSALKGDKEGFYKNMEKAVAIGDIIQQEFDEWTLFRELRKDNEYDERIKEAFGKVKKAVKND